MHITDEIPGEKRARLIFGLDWRAYSTKGKKDGRGRYAESFSASHYVEMEAGDNTNAGFVTLESDETKDVVLYSGAARVASLDDVKRRPAALVLIPDQDRVYLIYVVNGAVHVDEVLQPEQVFRRKQDIMEQAAKQGLVPAVLVSKGYASGDDQEFDPAQLTALPKVGKLKRVPKGIPNAVVYVALLGIIGLAVKIGFGAFSTQVVADDHQALSWQEQYATAVQTTFAGNMPQARLAAPRILTMFDSQESVMSGWQFNHTNCRVPGSCTLALTRMGGSYDEFLKAAPASMKPIALALDGQSLTAQGPVAPKVDDVDQKEQEKWPTEQQFIDKLMSPVQRMATKETDLAGYGYAVQLGKSTPIFSTPQPAGQPHVSVIRQGTWEIDGYRWQSELLDDLPSNMTLESVTVSLDQMAPLEAGSVGIKFVAQGKYYVVR
ncbi:hypothetical protein P3T25_005036 [Paraburkholderia sp. GAS32]